MKKTTITFLIAVLLAMSGIKAQTTQEGINHLYAGRIKNATGVFEKLLIVNPNNIDAMYWLGQTKLEADEIMSARIGDARKVYEKALQTTNGAPLIKVGMGHVELLAGNTDMARQHFETALTMTRGKKGDDPVIETAIGRAITDAKGADYKYAVKLLEDAAAKDPKNTETLLQLGNAHRKAGEGSGGGSAFQAYKKALEVNPSFAMASLRLAQLFESQRNWELVLQYLNEAISRDPKFTLAYYELFYYYFYRTKYDEAETYLQKFIESKLPESDIQDQYLYGQLCWARKNFDCAIIKAEGVVAAMGIHTKPKVYRLLADAYFQKGDFVNAKKFSDEFFAKKNPDDYNSYDHKLRADIMSKLGGSPDEILVNYIQGADLDTTLTGKVDFLKKGVLYFKEKKIRDREAILLQKIIELKPKPLLNDYFDLTVAHYFSQNYAKSRDAALKMQELFSDQVYGSEWAFNNSRVIDTVKKDSIAVPDALKLYDFTAKDTAKFKKQYISATSFLAIYYANDAKDKEKAIDFLKKWQAVDVANAENIQKNIDLLMRAPASRPPAPPTKSTGKSQPPAAKKTTTKSKSTTAKNTVAKQ
jgi:tetratricopeptide (TPR) repeat protein